MQPKPDARESGGAPTAAEWDRFVDAHPQASLYHTWRWSQFASEVFGFPIHRLTARSVSGELTGVLPLVLQTSLLFGRRLVSIPFFNYGGPLGTSATVEDELLSQASQRARSLHIDSLEIRDQVQRDGRAMRLDKVTVEMELPSSAEALDKSLGSKRRARVRRAEREGPKIAIGGIELLDDFYEVFAATMRDLGTPVYPKRFFSQMLTLLAGDCSVVTVRLDSFGGKPAAAALLTHFRDRTEIPWSAGLHELRETSVNMRLYWECFKVAIARGSRWFDFGRSTVDSGTYDFKIQWGGRPRQLYWIYPLLSPGEVPRGNGAGLRGKTTALWSRLPRPVATALGSVISPGLPW
jgi:serine/alanine adding enzyme